MATLATGAAGSWAERWRFVATIFAGSFLLFLVQPMIARIALPRLGGAPAVWNSAMLVYQGLLLAGYAYAHWLGRFAPRRQAGIHLAAFALAALTLPIGLLATVPSAQANPYVWVPWLLLVSIGPLFFVISAQAPLIQRWFALSGGGDPYPLYAASNLGSFAGLLAYPLILEPLMPVAAQRWLWSGGYVLLALLVAWCALTLPRGAAAAETQASEPADRPAWRTILMWIAYAAVPSGLILSTTLHITTDIVAMPLLWVLPLGAYLLSFTLAFSTRRAPAEFFVRAAPITLLMAACAVAIEIRTFGVMFAGLAIFNLFAVSVSMHSVLFERRPHPRHLTLFYLALSVGGLLGGIFAALAAPLLFDWTYEYMLLLVAAAFLLPGWNLFPPFERLWARGGRDVEALTLGGIVFVLAISFLDQGVFGTGYSAQTVVIASFVIIAIGNMAVGNRRLYAACALALMLTLGGWHKLALSSEAGKMTRSFFGVYAVRPLGDDARILVHGTTIHGIQNLGSPERERMATSYYAPDSGVGVAMRAAPALFGDQARIGIVGLGAGTLACYARPSERWTFYEIDPVVAQIAFDPAKFTFLSRCLPDAPVVLGDARLTLAQAPANSADLLVIDAFSSDSVPMHLLTREAFDTYRRHIGPEGLLLVHISNRYLDLEPVVAAASAAGGWQSAIRSYSPDRNDDNYSGSVWVALSPSGATLDRLVTSTDADWQEIEVRPGFSPWRDDHASLLPLIRWRN